MDKPSSSSNEKQGGNPESKERINRGFWELIYGVSEYLQHMFDLEEGMDRDGTISYIKNNKRMQGANVWLLVCSIMVASIGLDLNSQAVIIGAMLISPLMSPILGVGLGVAINDKETLAISLQHFGIAVLIALITSVIYFTITPYGTETEQIRARTVPTFLDAMVAIFGGLAGIVSASRKDKSNAIPGVAIATALMPPLCVAGYGLAKGNWAYFMNSFYLFFLNSVFIALTTYFIVRLLRFPYKTYVNRKDKFRTTLFISIFSIIVLIPSAWILYGVYKEIQQNRAVKSFMENEFTTDTRKYLSHQIVHRDSANYVVIDYYSDQVEIISEKEEARFEGVLVEAGIANPQIITRGTSEAQALINKKQGIIEEANSKQLEEIAKRQEAKDLQIEQLIAERDSIRSAKQLHSVVDEAKVFMPLLEDVDLVESKFDSIPILLVKWKESKEQHPKEELEQLRDFVKIKTQMDTLVVRDL